MEASGTGATPEERDEQAGAAEGGASADPTAAEGGDASAVESGTGEQPPEDERSPAHDQAPIASDAQDTIIGDPGLRDEQQPQQTEGAATAVNTPVRTSPPPPSAQSGVPLSEDRAAGVEPGTGAPAAAEELGEDEDGS